MTIQLQSARQSLRDFDLRALFIEELGWDNYKAPPLVVSVDGQDYRLMPVVQKRDMVLYAYDAGAGDAIPDYATRRKIEKRAIESGMAYEHIIVYRDAARQVWQWVKREPGKPDRNREQTLYDGQSPDALLRKLDVLAVALEDEDVVDIAAMAGRARRAFDVEGVTKKFYDRFQKEHGRFLAFIEGIQAVAGQEWYASLMLNRLMFIYFMQKRGFLDGDPDYLRTRLRRMKERHGDDSFHGFYRYFLLRLFHEGLAQQQGTRAADLEDLLGHVPYLNGGLFEVHELEQANAGIRIPDRAFEDIFAFFDDFDWTLDQRPPRANIYRSGGKTVQRDEINPDVLGYIFEKYINQKQMGAYYTKEDITEYIGKSAIIPFLCDRAAKECAVAFRPDGALWGLLRDDPDRYIYPAVRQGTEAPLPEDIAAGLRDISRREGWNGPAAPGYALPTETWREHVARRTRYEEVRARLAAGEVHRIDDLVTDNLDLRRFAEDAIRECEGPETLRAFYHALEQVTVLDPTCGSGAFLFAALNILEPLYAACLDRMQGFVDDLDHRASASPAPVGASGGTSAPHHKKYEDFRKILARIDDHPSRSRDYYIHKQIIVNNLYGVDIMEEAVEICKLRLFLTLVARLERPEEIEPLPDIDFNIRAGNTLVGYASYDELRAALGRRLDFDNVAERIRESAELADRAFQLFHRMQTEEGMDAGDFTAAKREVRARLDLLRAELDRYLAIEYNRDPDDPAAFAAWRASHQPFHWFSEFYGIMNGGGFDVIIGNPPYVELSVLTQYRLLNYACQDSGNLYALVMERCSKLCPKDGRQGFIVPVSSVSTDRYVNLQRLLNERDLHYSSFDDRPSRLFDGIEHIRLTIHLIGKLSRSPLAFSTRYNKWLSIERPSLFESLDYEPAYASLVSNSLPKLSSTVEQDVLRKMSAQKQRLSAFYVRNNSHQIFYSRKIGYFLQVLDFEPLVLDGQGNRRPPSEFKQLSFASDLHAKAALCCLNANLFYWFVTVFSDCRHVNKREVDAFLVNLEALTKGEYAPYLVRLAEDLMVDLQKKSTNKNMAFKHDSLTLQCIFPKRSKSIIDEIDRVLARHYGFTDEELDFIINYDIKYRMGQGADAGEEDA